MRYLTFMLLLPCAVSADALLVSESGTWGSSAVTSTWVAPNETWSYSFNVRNNPIASNVSLGHFFFAPFTNFVYTLNGSPVATKPKVIAWFSTSSGGLIDIAFGPGVFVVEGAQAYSGSESFPAILSGIYPLRSSSFFVDSTSASQPLTGNLNITVVTPEPSTLLMILMGSALIGAFRFSRRAGKLEPR